MHSKNKTRVWLFVLLFPIGYGYIYVLEHMQKELGDDGVLWVSILAILLILLIGLYSFSNKKIKIGKQGVKECLAADEYVKGVQISISFPRSILLDPYFVNDEHFYKMRIVLRYLEPLLALGIIISFFLPWISMAFSYMTPYELVKLDNFESKLSLLVIIPFSLMFLIFISFFLKFIRVVSVVVGFIPFLLITFLIYNENFEELTLQSLLYGFYICLFLSVLLIVLPLYKMFNETSILNKKKIAFNSKLLKPWLAFALLGSFFLPWFTFDFSYLSGYELLLDGTHGKLYWFLIFVPLLAITLLVHYRLNMKIKVISFLTGIIPYAVLVIAFSISSENVFPMLSLGAYSSLLIGTVLIFLSLRYRIKTNNKNKQ